MQFVRNSRLPGEINVEAFGKAIFQMICRSSFKFCAERMFGVGGEMWSDGQGRETASFGQAGTSIDRRQPLP